MAQITDYASLQAAIADWLARADLTARIPEFIQSAEARLNRDRRVREVTVQTPFTITGDGQSLPADFGRLHDWRMAGPTHFHTIELTSGGGVGEEVAWRQGTPGVPRVAYIAGGQVHYGPSPNAEYATHLSYYRRVPALTDADPTNWLLSEHPDIYRYAVLAEAAPYLKDDERLPMWEATLEQRLEALWDRTQEAQFSGPMRRRAHVTFGG